MSLVFLMICDVYIWFLFLFSQTLVCIVDTLLILMILMVLSFDYQFFIYF